MCSSGTVIEIHAEHPPTGGELAHGILESDSGHLYMFYAAGSSGRRSSPIATLATAASGGRGTSTIRTAPAGTGHSVGVVGMFDLPGEQIQEVTRLPPSLELDAEIAEILSYPARAELLEEHARIAPMANAGAARRGHRACGVALRRGLHSTRARASAPAKLIVKGTSRSRPLRSETRSWGFASGRRSPTLERVDDGCRDGSVSRCRRRARTPLSEPAARAAPTWSSGAPRLPCRGLARDHGGLSTVVGAVAR